MKQHLLTAAMLAAGATLCAQTKVPTNPLSIHPKADVTIPYRWDGEGIVQNIKWGFDTAWMNEQNMRKGINHLDGQPVDIVRVSFTPWEPLKNGTDLTTNLKKTIDERIRLANFAGRKVPVEINDDHATVDPCYTEKTGNKENDFKSYPENWVALIKATAKYYASKGHPIETIAPFNEPDYWQTGQGTKKTMKEICRLLKEDSYFDGIRISGGNTLNDDCASEWYNYMKEYLDEGNTHQLAGDFDHYANFFAEVRADGKYATADELHNIMEAFVGAEYGMQTGIWWGSAERARGELMKAMHGGERLGYGENRQTWMAGAVYRQPSGKMQAFIGQSERQANTTSFSFRSDRNVWYEGVGPLREFYVNVESGRPGDYQNPDRQHNGERVYDLFADDDIPPVIDGTYYLVNRANGNYLLDVANNNDGTQLRTYKFTGEASQQWEMHQLPETIGGDYSYHSMVHVSSGKAPDVWNWSLDDNANICLYGSTLGGNQVYHLEYAGDGYFRLLNKESNKYLQPSATGVNKGVVQSSYKATDKKQQWRLVPVGVKPEFTAPAQPSGLSITPQSASLHLAWNAVEGDETLAGYTLLRSTNADDGYETVARDLTATEFIDHDILPGVTYYYKVKATDTSLNSSEASEVASGATQTSDAVVGMWTFDDADSLYDCTENRNDMLTITKPSFSAGKIGKSLYFNGTSQFAQLPYNIASHQSMTFCAWVKWVSGGGNWQRIFDFGFDTDHYMFLTPSNGSNMVFGIKNGGEEETLKCSKLPTNKWVHVAVTIGNNGVTIYIGGEAVASSSTISLRPIEIGAAFNYLGRSQFDGDPFFRGNLDDVRLYNYALGAEQIATIASMTDAIDGVPSASNAENATYDLSGRRATTLQKKQIYITNGSKHIK